MQPAVGVVLVEFILSQKFLWTNPRPPLRLCVSHSFLPAAPTPQKHKGQTREKPVWPLVLLNSGYLVETL